MDVRHVLGTVIRGQRVRFNMVLTAPELIAVFSRGLPPGWWLVSMPPSAPGMPHDVWLAEPLPAWVVEAPIVVDRRHKDLNPRNYLAQWELEQPLTLEQDAYGVLLPGSYFAGCTAHVAPL